MGFLRSGTKQEEPDENEQLEEQYERLFAKIGRDFVFIDDLKKVLNSIQQNMGTDLTGSTENYSTAEARKRASEYKSLLDSGKDGSKIYKDLIDLSED